MNPLKDTLALVGAFALGIMFGVQIARNSSRPVVNIPAQNPTPADLTNSGTFDWYKRLRFDSRFSEN